MTNPFGGFTEEALAAYQKALAEREGTDFAECDSYDFTTCIRPDGSAYGTGGTCRKGSPGEARKEARGEMVKQRHEVSRLKQAREAAAGGEDKKAAAEARRQHIDAKKKLKELQGKHESLREESGDLRRFGTSTNRYKATDDDLKKALDSGKLSANTAEKVRVELAQRKAFGGSKEETAKKPETGEQSKVTATPGMAARAKAAKEKLKAEKAASGGKRPDRIQEERRLEQNRKQREMDRKVKANQEKQENMLRQPAKKPEQSTADKAMAMVMANARARGLTEIKRSDPAQKPADVQQGPRPAPKGGPLGGYKIPGAGAPGMFNKAYND